MAKTGTLVGEVDIKCGVNLLREIFRCKPHEMALMTPDIVQRCDLLAGQWGEPGSVISWHFILDGKVNTVKELIEAVDDETHKVVFKVIEGDVLEAYTALTFTVCIEAMDDKQLAIWTLNFEKANQSIPDPTPFLDLLCAVTKNVDAYIHP